MKIDEIKRKGLWPESKKTTKQKGNTALEDLGYNLFYIGKNADLYTCPGNEPKVLLLRSDRSSVFDIPLNLEIEGKGILQTSISNKGSEYAKKFGIDTAILNEKINIDGSLAKRCQIMQLCKPLEASVPNYGICQFEFIFRNYLTGSLYESCKNGADPYGLDLPTSSKEWDKFDKPLFTPTTKGIKDLPLRSRDVRVIFPEIIDKLERLFVEFSQFAYSNGIVIVDTKFEVFLDETGKWLLGDEVLTPESSRFIKKEDFEQKNYISMDKQILRNFATKDQWKEKAKTLKIEEKLEVTVPEEIKEKILLGYESIYNRLYSSK